MQTVTPQFVEFHAKSNFSFLEGGSHPEEIVAEAARLQLKGLSITDRNSLAGVVRAHIAAKEHGIRYHVGSEFLIRRTIDDHFIFPLLIYPKDRAGYGKLCRLLSLGNLRAEKGSTILSLEDLAPYTNDLFFILLPPELDLFNKKEYRDGFKAVLSELKNLTKLELQLSLGISKNYAIQNAGTESFIRKLSQELRVSLIATNRVLYHSPLRRPLQDVLTCIRHGVTINNAGFLLRENGERYIKDGAEMLRLFKDTPSAVRRTVELSEALSGFSLDQLAYEYPDEICPDGISVSEYLEQEAWRGAHRRYPEGIPQKVTEIIRYELGVIKELQYEKYFLTCYDIVNYARGLGILCQGRGSAANSVVCFCLGITSVDPDKIDVLLARFISRERNEPPDIDIDFEHERREEVIQYIYKKYGRDRAGLVSEVVTYQPKSAIRDIGKVLGLSVDQVNGLSKSIHYWNNYEIPHEHLAALGISHTDPRLLKTIQLSKEMIDFPRHLSQHVGGFIISRSPLIETVPVLKAGMEGRTIIEWNKDDIELLKMLKIDILALGMLTCIGKALETINSIDKTNAPSRTPLNLATIPAEDPKVYDMMCAADTVGVFQIESRAQMSMLPRLKPRCFYDIVIEVAIVRPGPIRGNMVHPFLARRHGTETVHYPDERVRQVLGKTMGVPIFQEQAMRLSIVLADFTPEEADKLRRAMAAWRRNKALIKTFTDKIIHGMTSKGYSEEFALSCVNQLQGFSEYGFPESHAASFAHLVYASAWIKRHHPAHFVAALLNSQPMGFYPPSQLISDFERHGGKALPISIRDSGWDTKVINEQTIRLGFHLVKGLSEIEGREIEEIMTRVNPNSLYKIWHEGAAHGFNIHRRSLIALARADAFAPLGINRRQALLEIKSIPIDSRPLERFFENNNTVNLPIESKQLSIFKDYESIGLSLKGHPIGIIRSQLNDTIQIGTLNDHLQIPNGDRATIAGLIIFRQRPPTAKGFTFLTIEDETGIANIIIKPNLYAEQRHILPSTTAIKITGIVERIGPVNYLNAIRMEAIGRRI
jgi:error-prone DNA polymerase